MKSTKTPSVIIGLTGPVGSGVSTVSRILEAASFYRISLSDSIKKELAESENVSDISKLPDLRKRLQDIGNNRRQESISYWVDKALENVKPDKDIVIDAIRNFGEVAELRNRFSNFYLLATVATKEKRWDRIKDQYQGNQTQFEFDDRRDSDEELEHGQQVQRCVLESDYVFINDDSNLGSSAARDDKLREKLLPEIELMRGQCSRHPTTDEVQMATAYAQSHASYCIKRQVGAVIVDVNGLPISIGFNENPIGMKPCIFEYKHCYKDENMHVKLENMKAACCPKCGNRQEMLKKPWKCNNCGENIKLALFPSRNMEVCTALHAEERAVKGLNGRTAEGATMYVTTFPCFQCARYIIEAKIGKVVYVEPYPVVESKELLGKNKVEVIPFSGFTARSFPRMFKQAR